MELRLDALAAHLQQAQQKGLQPIYTVYGDEPLLVMEATDAIRQVARKQGFSEREVYVQDRSFSWDSLLASGQAMSLFGERKIIELRMPTGKPGKEGADALKQWAAWLAGQNDILTIIHAPRLDAATTKSAWFTALQQAGVAVKIDKVERAQLPGWISQRLTQQGQRLETGEAGRRAVQFMADKVEGNLLAALQEIRKLGLLYPEGEITLAQVQDAVLNVARYDVFKLSEAMLAGDVPRWVRMLEGLRGEGEALVLVLWAVTEEIRVLCKVKAALRAGTPVSQVARDFRIWGPRERLVPEAAQRLSAATLEQAMLLAAQLDRQSKGLRSQTMPADAWQGLSQLGMLIAQAGPQLSPLAA